ncbi:aminomethyltransferase family protein [Arthrobacter sp. YN]|uniref:aminomethyltransferase family protein n=1 Tax=Arthrobacter sp. YN TaxID=2020486 RepID=UPI0018DF05CB|nr:aminomethyltransferase family protein [Arthrobacter sp. YN]
MVDEKGPVHTLAHVSSVPFDPTVSRYVIEGLGLEPDEYRGWEIESRAAKSTCFVGDWTPVLLHMHVEGPDATRFFNSIAVNSFENYGVGQAKHLVLCNEQGKVMGEGILMKLGENEYHYTSTPGVIWANYLFQKGSYDAVATDLTGQRFIIQLQGPSSLALLNEIVDETVAGLRFMRFEDRQIAGAKVRVLRQGMAGELGYELHGDMNDSIGVWNAILQHGAKFGLERQGARARMINHVEASFPTPGVDFIPAWVDHGNEEFGNLMSDSVIWSFLTKTHGSYPTAGPSDFYYSPYELGWGRNVAFDHDFTGRAALEAEAGREGRKHVTLVWDSKDCAEVISSLFDENPYEPMQLPRGGLGLLRVDAVRSGDELVGASVSRCFSPHFRQMISLAVVDPDFADPGTEVTVTWGAQGERQKEIRAVVAGAPYKEDKRRLDTAATV